MKLFECQNCRNPVHFDNTACVNCGYRLGYLADRFLITAVEPDGGAFRALGDPTRPYLFCDNAEHDACNWLVPAGEGPSLCLACQHNRTVPDLSIPENLVNWRKMEAAKHHLFYSLTRWNLPMPTREEDPEAGLAFDFLADTVKPDGDVERVLTGHDSGLITINIVEADDAEREARRTSMKEPYRTLLGHFRHEVGHYYWDRLVRDRGNLDRCRALFGDETRDYGEALQAHYTNGPPADWQTSFISTYATAHPWEDFAETWAHYLHIVDALETARAFGIKIRPRIRNSADLEGEVDFQPYAATSVEDLIDAWVPLTVAINGVNRSMGQPDLYPFVLSAPVVEKLGFIHAIVHQRTG
ncbi:zinc-binding metallopeptidase family protein [Chthonobacter rhizosphaerae]|uniref:zinc-binding metallopeptidase family protein n=1 Tax=Chthonobacter rhizosphaerae TaxID=2735553 RepID=UPI0015EFA356|nr:putative zinc-binding peptidase [Chthonobacter rhizosphaerae]